MVTVNWGLLAKSAVDSEKIEEAIARLILEHNEDEESHLAAGQSLQSHKAAAIIDHIAQSIVEDKLKDYNVTPVKIGMFIFNTFFESLDGYYKTAGVSLGADQGYVSLTTTAVTNNEQYLLKTILYYPTDWDWDHDRFFETAFYLNSVDNVLGNLCFGARLVFPHIGFQFEDGKLYGSVGNGASQTTVELQNISAATVYKIYCEFFTGDRCDFYVDGELKGTINENLPSGVSGTDLIFSSAIKTKNDVLKVLRLSCYDVRQKI